MNEIEEFQRLKKWVKLCPVEAAMKIEELKSENAQLQQVNEELKNKFEAAIKDASEETVENLNLFMQLEETKDKASTSINLLDCCKQAGIEIPGSTPKEKVEWLKKNVAYIRRTK